MVGIGYGVTVGTTIKYVIARTALQCVVARAALQCVIARAATDIVGVSIADERVIAAATGNIFNVANCLGAVIAAVYRIVKVKIHLTGLVGKGYGVTAGTTIKCVAAGTAQQCVIARAASQRVVAGEAVNGVSAGAAGNCFGCLAAINGVIAGVAGQV